MHFGVAAAGLADLSDADDHDDIVASDHDGRVRAGTRRVGDGDAGRRAALLLPSRPPGPPRGGTPGPGHARPRDRAASGDDPGLVADGAERVRAQLGGPRRPRHQRHVAGSGRRRVDREGRAPACRPAACSAPSTRTTTPTRSSARSCCASPGLPSHLVEHGTLQAIAAHHRLGITAVYEPHAMEPRHIDVYRRLRDAGRLTMRVKAVPEYQRFTRPSDHQKSLAELASTLDGALAAVDVGDEWVRAEGITVSGRRNLRAWATCRGRRRTSTRSGTRRTATGSSRTKRSNRPSSSARAKGCDSTCVRWARPSTTSCSGSSNATACATASFSTAR